MAAATPRREIVYADEARRDLRTIWRWNRERYSRTHADGYIAFLHDSITALAADKVPGHAVADFPHLRYLLMQRRAGGHGHIAIFRSSETKILVARVFHTSQDWQATLSDEDSQE
jgi:plasmid stabilization system protein ParE